MNIPVSLKCSDTRTFNQTWHVGKTHDISVGGIRILSSSIEVLPLSSRLEILFFPDKEGILPYSVEPEPVRMTGLVMWQDILNKSIGVKLDS